MRRSKMLFNLENLKKFYRCDEGEDLKVTRNRNNHLGHAGEETSEIAGADQNKKEAALTGRSRKFK